MELNIPMSVHADGAGEVTFNTFITGISSLAGLSDVLSLPSGAYYHITSVDGNDGASIRNPVTNKPHTHGVIPHRFKRSGTIVTIQGDFIAPTPAARRQMRDNLRDVLDRSVVIGWPSADLFRFFWTPPGATTRLREGRCYEKLVVTGTDANPKSFIFSMYFEKPNALSYAQDLTHGGFAPNRGNVETWPNIKVYAGGPFTLSNGTYELKWGKTFLTNPAPILGSYILVDMYHQTMYWDGDSSNALNRLFMEDSDFWSIPVGGCTISCDAGIDVLSNDGWAG